MISTRAVGRGLFFGGLVALALAGNALAQVPEGGPVNGVASQVPIGPYQHDEHAPVAQAVRINVPISMDGRLDEAIWMTAPAISDFRQTVPNEGQPVTQTTEIRFLYDDDNIYVGAWLWDTGQVLTRLARRDVGVPDADFFVVLFDSYHDHRTAYRFATSPAAMKRDEITSGGGNGSFGDTSWDPIWDVKTSITEQGWFVEIRVPFSQLRYSSDPVQVWGLQVERKIRRHGEDTVWAFTPRSERGGVPRYGHLVGIENIAQGKRLEMLPYVGARAEYRDIPRNGNATFGNPYRSGSDYFSNAGLDLKYRLTSNLTLDATFNPDFGQVEVDPAVINLTAFETRFDEKRPFFVEGGEIFNFGGGGQLLYSRRIGRSPQGSLPSGVAYSDMPGATTILGAAKLTAKTPAGWSFALLDAITAREKAPYVNMAGEELESVVEPLTNYLAGRARFDRSDGSAYAGIIATAVNRDLSDEALRSRLRSAGYSAGIDGRLDIFDRNWMIAGQLSPSYIMGEAEAIDIAQRSSARYYQRPDADHLDHDPTATSLFGLAGSFDLSKQTGDWRGGASFAATTPGYEVNDMGFQSAADRINASADWGYNQNQASQHFRSWSTSASTGATWNFGEERQSWNLNWSANATLANFYGFNVRFGKQFESEDDRLTRGGPNALAPGGWSTSFGVNSDGRKPLQVRTGFNYSSDDAGGWSRGVNFNVTYRFRAIYEFTMGPNFSKNRNPAQFVTSIADETAGHTFNRRYIFAPIDQTTLSLTTRFNATFTPDLSLELYAQPLLSSGDYDGFMELSAPSTFDFDVYGQDIGTSTQREDGRYVIDPDGAGPAASFTQSDRDFNVRSLNGSAVLRWEWRPGSTMFVVWQQARSERLTPVPGDTQLSRVGQFAFDRDARALFGIRPENIFMIKLNYWLNP